MKTTLLTLLAVMAFAGNSWAITCPSGSAFELRRPSDGVPLGCVTGSSGNGRFAISSTAFNGVDQNWPGTQGAASTVLTNNGSGGLSWAAGGSGGHTITTGTAGSHSSFPSRTKLNFDSTYFTAVDSSTMDMTQISLTAAASGGPLGSTSSMTVSAQTTNSMHGPCVSTNTITVSQGSRLMVGYSGQLNCTTTICSTSFLLDGNFAAPFGNHVYGVSGTTSYGSAGWSVLTSTLAAGTHSTCLTLAGAGGTITIPGTGAYQGNNFYTYEVPAVFGGAGGGSIYVDTFTALGNVGYSNTSFNTCLAGSTVTFTTSGRRADIVLSGSIGNQSGGYSLVRILVDGAEPTNFPRTYNGAGLGEPHAAIGINYRTPTALSAGSHSFCIQTKVSSGSASICTADLCQFSIREVP